MKIDAGAPAPKIARNIFGQFAEHLGTGIQGGVRMGKASPILNTRGGVLTTYAPSGGRGS